MDGFSEFRGQAGMGEGAGGGGVFDLEIWRHEGIRNWNSAGMGDLDLEILPLGTDKSV